MLMSGAATSYELKRRVQETIGNFWTFNHSQIYDEPLRLLKDGLVDCEREPGGRQRRTYSITGAGRDAFAAWLAIPDTPRVEVRDTGLLKLFFGTHAQPADLRALMREQLEMHRRQADEYSRMRRRIGRGADRWQLASLELGIAYERRVQGFWEDLLASMAGD